MKGFALLFTLVLASCSTKVWHTASIQTSNSRMNDSITADDSILLKMIYPYKLEKESKMNFVVAENEIKLDKAKPESTLTNWVADIIEESVELKTNDKIDATFLNYGGIRSNYLAKGPVTIGHIFELMPFDNLVVVLRIKGEALQIFCDHIAKSGGWPVSKSLHFIIKDQKATQISIKSVPLDPKNIYRICVPDYVANGGDDCTFLKEIPQTTYKYLLRDAILDGVNRINLQKRKISSISDGRISIQK